jgi:tetratricopeptide (TPR) repeat protein
MTSVREARHALASALAAADQPKKALEQLKAALSEPGATPTAAELNLASGQLHAALGSASSAFDAYLRAVHDDPALGDGASAALRLLATAPELALAQETAGAVQAAVSLARADAAAPAVASLLLAGRLLHLSGDLAGAAEMLELALARQPGNGTGTVDELVDVLLESGQPERAREIVDRYQSCGKETECWLLLEERRFDEALDLAARPSEQAHDTQAEAVRLLALTALGRPAEALAATEVPNSADGKFARLVAFLAQQDYDAAQKAADDAARAVGTEPIALVIRAQVVLEKAGHEGQPPGEYESIREARRSLKRVRRAAGDDPEAGARVLRHRWMRLQRAVRSAEDRFHYALAEAIVALDTDIASRRSAVANCPTAATTFVQDAALCELAVKVLDTDLDSPADQAQAYDDAAMAFDRIDETDRAREFAERSTELLPNLRARTALADLAWRASYSQTIEEPARLAHLEKALQLLDGDGSLPVGTGSQPGYLRGLLLARRAELGGGDGGWRSLPYLLAAALASDDGIRWANLASVLTDLHARACALACADRAQKLSTDSPFAQETYIAAEVNFLADPDRTAQAVDAFHLTDEYASWCAVIKLMVAALNMRKQEVRELLPLASQRQDSWGRWTVFQAELLIGDLDPASEKLVAFADELEKQGTDLTALSEVRRFLGQLDASDEAITRAEQSAVTPPSARTVARHRAEAALLRDPAGGGEAELARLLRDEIASTQLLNAINVNLPLLDLQTPKVRPATARLRRIAKARLREVQRKPARLTEDFALAEDRTDRAPLTRQLLDLTGLLVASDWTLLAERVGTLDVSQAAADGDDFLAEALGEAKRAVVSQIARAIADRFMTLAVGGDTVAAATAYQAGTEIQSEPSFPAEVAAALSSVADYRPLMAALDVIGESPRTIPEVRDAVVRTRELLLPRLEDLLGLHSMPDPENPAAKQPVVVSLGDLLVPLADPKQDGNVFIGELIPQLRERIFATSGVRVSSLLMRGSYTLPPDRFTVEIYENWVASGSVPTSGEYAVRAATPDDFPAAEPGEATAWRYVTRFHPRTGKVGVWIITPSAEEMPTDDDRPEDPARLSPTDLLIHAIEESLRPRLAALLGPEEVSRLVDEWLDTPDRGEVAAVVPDQESRLALTWVLQSAVRHGLSIADWRGTLSTIADVGGLTAPTERLLAALRARLVHDGDPSSALPRIRIPAELEEALIDGPRDGARPYGQARHQLLTWVRQRAAQSGRVLILVASGRAGRDAVDAIIRAESDLIQTVCETEPAA